MEMLMLSKSLRQVRPRPAHNISHVQKIQTILEQEETKVNIDDLLPQGNEKATVRTQIFEAAIVFVGVSSFYDYLISHVLLAGVITAIFTVLINFLILKLRFESEYVNELSTQVFLYDYLIAFLLSLYFVDALNIVNGLF